MAPAIYRKGRGRRQPLAPTVPAPQDPNKLVSELREIFNSSQYPGSTDSALEDLKKLYKRTGYGTIKEPFRDMVKRLLQSKQSNYSKTACTFLCKFLQYLSKESDEVKKVAGSPPQPKRSRPKQPKKKTKKRSKLEDSESEDEIVAGFFKKTNKPSSVSDSSSDDDSASVDSRQTVTITDHDRLISSCVDIADFYMQVADEDCRFNAVFFICKFLAHVESLDEEICEALKGTLPKRIRDKKSIIRAQAVLASRTFQDAKLIQEAFKYHFSRDPELIVRKALLQIMDTKIFGHDFLVDSTQDSHEIMRKAAYQRLNKLSPLDLNTEQFHRAIHNGLSERDAQSAHRFKNQTLWPWLSTLYDGLDLHKMLEPFDVINYSDDIICLLNNIYDHDLQQPQNNGASTKLHHVVENFRQRWLSDNPNCLPNVETVDERLVIIWFSMVKFCRDNQPIIESVRLRTIHPEVADQNESIEKLLESQENKDEVVELYERLVPDLVNFIDFLKEYLRSVEKRLKNKEIEPEKAEFTYLQIMDFVATYEVGDELERKTVQEVFDTILKESLLVGYIDDFIPPIIRCLYKLVYKRSSNLMVNYISELIQNVRSHLEDIISPDTTTSSDPLNPIFQKHPKELIKCLQMYLGCLQNVRVTEVPDTMRAHLRHLSYESLEDWYNGNTKIRCLMVACNGVTALIDKNFIQGDETCMELLVASCFDESSLAIQTTGFKCLVDVVCQHDEIEFPEQSEKFISNSLRLYERVKSNDFGTDKLELITAVIEGTAKLFYLQKLKSPDLLAYLIIWWYYPHTPSKLKQFIGIFLPIYVNDLMKERHIAEASWFRELLMDTFVISVETLHEFILDKCYNLMAASDILSLINFLSNLIPVSLHSGIAERIDDRMSELGNGQQDLMKYLKQSKSSLTLREPSPTQVDSTPTL